MVQFWRQKRPAQDRPKAGPDMSGSRYIDATQHRYSAAADRGAIDKVHICATWRTRLNRPCVAVIRSYEKLPRQLLLFLAPCCRLSWLSVRCSDHAKHFISCRIVHVGGLISKWYLMFYSYDSIAITSRCKTVSVSCLYNCTFVVMIIIWNECKYLARRYTEHAKI